MCGQSMVKDVRRGAGAEAGVALASAMFGLVAVSLLITGVFVMTDLQSRAGRNREMAARAMHVAEAGLAHALATIRVELRDTTLSRLLRGFDNVANSGDDGYLSGYPINSSLWIPAGGRSASGGTYYVQFLDDPNDPDANPTGDANGQILARCRGTTSDGAVADIEAIVSLTLLPGVVVDGPFTISGDPQMVGACGGVHANQLIVVSGNPTVEGRVTASGNITVSGSIDDPSGNPVTPLPNQPPLEVPALNPLDHCAAADYILQANGYVLVVATGVQHNATSNEKFGWKRSSSSPVKWDLSGASAVPGTVCAYGNVSIGGNPGSPGSPLAMSVIATGSIEVSGNPYITSDHPDNISFLAGGDIKFGGSPDVLSDNYSGLIYAGGQCMVSGDPKIQGQLVCKNQTPQPSGVMNLVDENTINGNPEMRFGCGSNLLNRRRILYWYPRLGA